MSKIYKEINPIKRESQNPIKWKQIKDLPFEDEDEITIAFDEGFYSDNNSWDAHFYLSVSRKVLETDEEYDKRIKKEERDKEESKKRRYENYLKLKKEFEI